jgi:GT2 family glycosyltransferase
MSSPVNLDLAGTGNRGRQLANGELLVLLHDDAEVEPGCLKLWLRLLMHTPRLERSGGKVFSRMRLQQAGLILWRNANAGASWAGETQHNGFQRVRAVAFCGTSSLLVRAALWDAIGGLDERFCQLYYVDVDLAMAQRHLGYVVLYQRVSGITRVRAPTIASDRSF